MRVSVCLSVCLSAIISRNYTSDLHEIFLCMLPYGRGSVLVWRRSDTLCTSGFMDDVMSRHKPRLLAARLRRSSHAALGLTINGA